ncbi:MAG TPA: sulfatase [Opitutaceae bacterium]|nr:sulfatase [Opitutaceae bacterium]
MPVSRRQFLGQLAGAAVAGSLPHALRAQNPRSAPHRSPNVLFLMSDDMRVELGCYQSWFGAITPNIDRLASSGVRFDRNFCQFPLCNPSRSSLFTAHRPTATGVLNNRQYFRTAHPDWVTLPQLFRQHGYRTIRHGKIYHGGIDDLPSWDEGGGVPEGPGGAGGHSLVIPPSERPDPADQPPAALARDHRHGAYSDRVVVLDGHGEGHPDYQTADTAIATLRRLKQQNQPWFFGCGFSKPHSPPCAPQSFLDLYDVNRIKLTPDFAPSPTVPPGFPRAAIRPHNADLFIGRHASVAEAREVIRGYIASISWVDWNIGRVLAELDRLGLRESTIVVLAVDHGYQLGEKGKWSKAGSLFEMGTRVPLIVSAPGMTGNGRPCYRIVESIDIYSTLAELCGLPRPAGIEGVSLVPLLRDPSSQWDRPAFSVWSENGRTLHGVAVRTNEWRFAEFGPAGANGAMLFDPHGDPLEMTNLANDPKYAEVCRKLSALTRAYAA